jgi:thiol-disulfide isomerase/thioredoxin
LWDRIQMSTLSEKTIHSIVLASLAMLLFPSIGCTETQFAPFKAPEPQFSEWLTPNPPQPADFVGRPYVIEFWASWCHTCKNSVTEMTGLQNTYGPKGLIIIAISQDTSSDDARKFISERRVNYHVAMDNGASGIYSVKHIPTVFVIDHHGQVVWRGYPWEKGFEETVKKVLAESPPPVTGGVHLGPYEKYRTQLLGGPGFAGAYRDIKAQAGNAANPDAAAAGSIITAIDTTISRKTNQARSLRYSDPGSAFRILAQLVKDYGDIPPVKPATDIITAMKTGREIEPELYAANI